MFDIYIKNRPDVLFGYGEYFLCTINAYELGIVEKDGKFGGVNIYNEVIIPFKYDMIRGYSEGLFVVKKDGKYGYINKYNELVIDFQYDRAEAFEYGKAVVFTGNDEMIIDQTGKVQRKL